MLKETAVGRSSAQRSCHSQLSVPVASIPPRTLSQPRAHTLRSSGAPLAGAGAPWSPEQAPSCRSRGSCSKAIKLVRGSLSSSNSSSMTARCTECSPRVGSARRKSCRLMQPVCSSSQARQRVSMRVWLRSRCTRNALHSGVMYGDAERPAPRSPGMRSQRRALLATLRSRS
eukprot:scaffold117264_cov72-Phaeocystis_antarctica.AAC.4